MEVLTDLEKENLKKAERLRSLMSMEGWNDVVQVLADISQGFYPDPRNNKYDHFPWEGIEKDYTFARGGTEVVKKFMMFMHGQEGLYQNLIKKAEAKEEDADLLYEKLK